MSEKRGKMDARISCSTEVRDSLRHIADGAGLNYDELLQFLIEHEGGLLNDRDNLINVGLELRKKMMSRGAKDKNQ
jgi:hypothetical protein